jgi:hypothetical protein
MTGQVPARTTYSQWLRRQPRSVGNKVTVDRFVDDKRRVLTLEELRRREGLSTD